MNTPLWICAALAIFVMVLFLPGAWRRFWASRELHGRFEHADPPPYYMRPAELEPLYTVLQDRHRRIRAADVCPGCGTGLGPMRFVLAQRRLARQFDLEAAAELRQESRSEPTR